MKTKTIKLIAFLALLIHGIGHLQGVVAGMGIKISNAVPGESWLLKNLNSDLIRKFSLVLFLITPITGILSALSFKELALAGHWQILALITAFLSSFCLIVFPGSFAMFFNKIGAIAVNLAIFYSILFGQQWPASIFND